MAAYRNQHWLLPNMQGFMNVADLTAAVHSSALFARKVDLDAPGRMANLILGGQDLSVLVRDAADDDQLAQEDVANGT